jgi:hypothetical protein
LKLLNEEQKKIQEESGIKIKKKVDEDGGSEIYG